MIKYVSITSPDINNGLGCRITVWISGCTHKCPGCQNFQLWDYSLGKPLLNDAVISKIVDELNSKPYLKGITFSGGDPLDQSATDLSDLAKFIHEIKSRLTRDIDIWVYSGFTYEELINNPFSKRVLELCDILVDGPYMQELRDITLPFRGSSNQRIIDLKLSLEFKKIVNVDICEKNR